MSNWFKKIADFLLLPLRVLLSHEMVEKYGLTSMAQERINAVETYLGGRTLDIACGYTNRLARTGRGKIYGLDIQFYPAIDVQGDSQQLPFKDGVMDNIVVLSSLEYIPDKVQALKECYRVLKKGGKILITSINPWFCTIRWKLAFWNKYTNPRRGGVWKHEILSLFRKSDFGFVDHKKFVYGLNNFYIGEKNESCVDQPASVK